MDFDLQSLAFCFASDVGDVSLKKFCKCLVSTILNFMWC